LLRALETASIIAQPHGLSPQPLDDLIECDVGEWEGMDWQTICRLNPDYYSQFMEQPGDFGYPSGESFAEVYERTSRCLDTLLSKHAGKAILVVAHHVVNRTFLAGILGLSPNQARHVTLDNCGISMITREADKTTVTTLNAAFHLQGIAA
jgi:broad specificity phosphatase PhoE